jgi:hypothetical protein
MEVFTDLVRYILLVWHDLVQAEKSDQPESLQSTGQLTLLQGSVWPRLGQATPP